MQQEPKVEYYNEQYYVAIRTKVKMQEISAVLPPLIPEVLQWIAQQNIVQAGPVFFRYLYFDQEGNLLVDVGVPTQVPVAGNGKVISASLPAANYAVVTYMGDYSNLKSVHMELESWLKERGLKEGTQQVDGTAYAARTEFYITDPQEVPDPEKWRTDVAILLAGK